MDKFTITDSIPGPSTGLKKVLSVIRMDMGVFYMIDPENMPEPLRTALLSCAQSLKTVTPITDEKEQIDIINKLMAGENCTEHASISFESFSCVDFFSSRLLSLMMGSHGVEGLAPQAFGFAPIVSGINAPIEENVKLLGFVIAKMFGKYPAVYFTKFLWKGDQIDFAHPDKVLISFPQLAPRNFLGPYQDTWDYLTDFVYHPELSSFPESRA